MWPCAGLPALGWLRFGGIDHPALVAQRESPAQPGPGGGRGLEGCGAGSGPGRGTDLLSLSSGAWGQPAAPAWERSGHGAALPSVSRARPGLRPPTQGAFAFVSTSCGSRNRQRGGGWGGQKVRGPQEPRAGPVPGAGLGGDLLPGPSALSRHGGHMLAAAQCTSPVDTRQQTFKMAPGASPWAGDTCLPPGWTGRQGKARTGQGLG